MKYTISALFLLLLVLGAGAAELQTTVKYVSASSVYIDAGREAGIQVGDRVKISRGGDSLAVLEVVYISGTSASCKIIESKGELRSGDMATLQITPQPV